MASEKSQPNHWQEICTALSKMSERARSKREQKAQHSLCGKIKLIFWSFVFDQSAFIKRLQRESVANRDDYSMAIEMIQERINLNIAWFNGNNADDMREYKTPVEVRKQFLVKARSDQAGRSIDKQIYINRILALNRIWDDALKLRNGDAAARDLNTQSSDNNLHLK